MNQYHRYHIKHNGAILYFLLQPGESGEYVVVLNANGTPGCQHNGIQECGAGCEHIEQAKLLELQEQLKAQKYYGAIAMQSARSISTAPLNNRKSGFSLLH